MVLGEEFYRRPVLEVAPDLLGKYLVCGQEGESSSLLIHEVEAYDGADDKACHAHRGKTPRTSVMFKEGGRWYVYLVYGLYDMLNVVTGEKDYPAAVLIRGAGEFDGPGKLTRELGITREKYNTKSVSKETGLWVEDGGAEVQKEAILATTRIGVDYAGDWAEKPYRFLLSEKAKSEFRISKPEANNNFNASS